MRSCGAPWAYPSVSHNRAAELADGLCGWALIKSGTLRAPSGRQRFLWAGAPLFSAEEVGDREREDGIG